MKIFLFLILVAVIAGASLVILIRQSYNNPPPGLVQGQLAPCPNKPNCINSEVSKSSKHYTKAIVLNNVSTQQTLILAKSIISQMQGEITQEAEHYLATTFKTKTLKFIDDFELRVDQTNQRLHLRSASRLGYRDFGVNQARIDEFKQRFERAR